MMEEMEAMMTKNTIVNMEAMTLLLYTCKNYFLNKSIMIIVLSRNKLNPIDSGLLASVRMIRPSGPRAMFFLYYGLGSIGYALHQIQRYSASNLLHL